MRPMSASVVVLSVLVAGCLAAPTSREDGEVTGPIAEVAPGEPTTTDDPAASNGTTMVECWTQTTNGVDPVGVVLESAENAQFEVADHSLVLGVWVEWRPFGQGQAEVSVSGPGGVLQLATMRQQGRAHTIVELPPPGDYELVVDSEDQGMLHYWIVRPSCEADIEGRVFGFPYHETDYTVLGFHYNRTCEHEVEVQAVLAASIDSKEGNNGEASFDVPQDAASLGFGAPFPINQTGSWHIQVRHESSAQVWSANSTGGSQWVGASWVLYAPSVETYQATPGPTGRHVATWQVEGHVDGFPLRAFAVTC